MALRAVTAALDPLTLAEWRDRVCFWIGVTYTNLSDIAKTELNRLIDEVHDWVSKEYGHEPWARRVWTIGGSDFSSPSTSDGIFTLPADCRHIIRIQESENGTGVVGNITKMEAWMSVGAGATAHPWNLQDQSFYFFKAMSNDNPPVQTWQRVPTPTTALSAMTILGRGYFTLLTGTGDGSYTEIPAQLVPEMSHHAKALWASYRGDYQKTSAEMSLRNDAVRSTQINDAPDGAEVLIEPQPPQEFFDEMEV